ncbi:MAG: HPr family phosphocarrier protein [Sedimentisphaeraceae bacterium JB056]
MVDELCETFLEIRNIYGLHMRPAMMFAELAAEFDCDIKVRSGDMEVDGKSVAEVMTLGLPSGARMQVVAQGEDASRAIEAIKDLVEIRLFDEDSAP